MRFFKTLIIFLFINFGALALGAQFMGDGAQSDWYLNLNKAPWTPDGWVFGAAWTSIMILFSLYMTFLYLLRPSRKVQFLFGLQFILNVIWNALFFNQNLIHIALLNIMALVVILSAFLITYLKDLRGKTLLIVPYILWLCIATSLNLYISLYN
jgi:tryptophan-rich sensory protein